ncbi:MAG: hypothetical protein K6V73_12060 [Firmicutes bacterium]|nr:hypothetical protein [Bacillota bacterium]
MRTRYPVLLPLLALAVAGGGGRLGAAATAAVPLLGLAAGALLAPWARGAACRGAALGGAADALARALSLWRMGGAGAVALGSILPPAVVLLGTFVAAVAVGVRWRTVWRPASALPPG